MNPQVSVGLDIPYVKHAIINVHNIFYNETSPIVILNAFSTNGDNRKCNVSPAISLQTSQCFCILI